MTSLEEFNNWLKNPEGLNLEFKAATKQFDKAHKLPDYCAAIANEGGGKLILGVNNDGTVVGTQYSRDSYNKLSHNLLQELRIRIDLEELIHPQGRVLIFHIPSHSPGSPVKSRGKYLMRAGESLVEMDAMTLKKMLNETEPDFSATIVKGLVIDDLDEIAVANFRKWRAEKTGNSNIKTGPLTQVLADAGLILDGKISLAGLILLGKKEKIERYAPQAEIIYEWRNTPGQIHHDFRINWREAYFRIYDQIWETINARNLRVPFQEGFIQREIWAFDEKSCREAINNAVAHRDYTLNAQSVFILASPARFNVRSPGGFLPGITPKNILSVGPRWRNRLIADALEHTKLVERSGQGIDSIFESSIRQGKGLPNFDGTDHYTVSINMPAAVKDVGFVRFLEEVINKKQKTISFDELLELEEIRDKGEKRKIFYKDSLMNLGLIEKIGHGRGAAYILSRQYYEYINRTGIHTKLKGFSREQKKQMIINHIKKEGKGFSKDIQDALEMGQSDVNNLLQELKKAGIVNHQGSKRSGYWILY